VLQHGITAHPEGDVDVILVNLALAFSRQGHRAGILDTDIFGPSIPTLLNLSGEPRLSSSLFPVLPPPLPLPLPHHLYPSSPPITLPAARSPSFPSPPHLPALHPFFPLPASPLPPLTHPDNQLLPLTNYGVKAMSMGFLVPESSPVVWRGLMVMKALQQLLHEVDWGGLDVLVLDLPPGTGDTQLTITQQVVLDGESVYFSFSLTSVLASASLLSCSGLALIRLPPWCFTSTKIGFGVVISGAD